MNEKTFRVLEYGKIIDKLSERTNSSLARKMCSELMPSDNLLEIQDRLSETKEAYEIALKWGSLPLEGIRDISEAIRKAKIGYTLTPAELLNVCDVLRCTRRLKAFMKDGVKVELYPIVGEIVESLVAIKAIEEAVENAIISEEEISDKASPKLGTIRRDIKLKNSKVREKLQAMVHTYGKYLQDPIITLRGDRYVIPVKAECRGSVPGLVHDQSSSGSTLFIEPMAVVEINNEIKELILKEKAEIERILMELTAMVDESGDFLEHDNLNIAYLDFLMAKAKFGLDMNATIPEMNEKGIIHLKAARHPLIDKDKVVPIDIRLGETFNTLVITGPNTGGKTVTLKTAGLLTLMAMSGLGVPARDGSTLSVFKKVFADIGDEQSIEQSLSTFSSHMTNIVDIIKNVDDRSMVLVDELGAGTDPTEGAALAMSILEYYHNAGARIIGTTHYSELKVFAMEKPGFENGSVEFSIETLRPTYRLIIGIPGKSNAFEISSRLGLKDEIIVSARERISKDAAKFEDVIQALQSKTTLIEKELEETQLIKRETSEIKKELSERKYKLDTEKDKIIRKAQDEAKKLIRQAKEESDAVIKELTALRIKAQDAASAKDAEELRKKLKDKLDKMDVKEVNQLEFKDGMVQVTEVKPGEEVYVTTLSQKAVVISGPDSKGEVIVQAGVMKINVPLAKLMKNIKPTKTAAKTQKNNIASEKTKNITTSVDLRGQTLDEAMYNLDKYLDDAYLAGVDNVTVIHGKGTGALREGLKSYFKRHPHIVSMRMGDIYEGGSGVTIVEIKK